MKQAILPVGSAIIMIVVAVTVNPIVEIGGIILAGLIGLGIGVALNNLIFKVKKSTEKADADTKNEKTDLVN